MVGVMGYSTLVTVTMMIAGRSLPHVIQDMNQAEAELRAAAMTLREVGEETVPQGVGFRVVDELLQLFELPC